MKIKELQQEIFLRLASFLGEGEARAVVRLLMEHFTGYDNLYINLNPQTKISENTVNQVNIAVKQILENKPVQYVLGETVFCGLPFLVTDSVLVPRPETEELTNWVINENPHAKKLLDIGTGSGCIAVSLAKNIHNCEVYAMEISEDALKIAQKNAELNHVKINFMQGDILFCHSEFSSEFPVNEEIADKVRNDANTDIKFDVIVSNPPYVREMEKSYMHKRVLDYEPHIALFVEDRRPLLFYHAILKFGQTHLAKNGKLYFEINEYFGKELFYLYLAYGYNNICLKQDIHGKDRMICGEKLGVKGVKNHGNQKKPQFRQIFQKKVVSLQPEV